MESPYGPAVSGQSIFPSRTCVEPLGKFANQLFKVDDPVGRAHSIFIELAMNNRRMTVSHGYYNMLKSKVKNFLPELEATKCRYRKTRDIR